MRLLLLIDGNGGVMEIANFQAEAQVWRDNIMEKVCGK